jgi:hypothetical protein
MKHNKTPPPAWWSAGGRGKRGRKDWQYLSVYTPDTNQNHRGALHPRFARLVANGRPRSTPGEIWTGLLPYGKWTCADGREVLFNRDYQAIWQRYPGRQACEADPFEWVEWLSAENYFDDGSFRNPQQTQQTEVERDLDRVGLTEIAAETAVI